MVTAHICRVAQDRDRGLEKYEAKPVHDKQTKKERGLCTPTEQQIYRHVKKEVKRHKIA